MVMSCLGTIEFEEYLTFMLTFIKKNVTTEDNLRDAFSLFDQDRDGFIGPADLRDIMTNLGEKVTDEDIDEMIREADIGTSNASLRRSLRRFVTLVRTFRQGFQS